MPRWAYHLDAYAASLATTVDALAGEGVLLRDTVFHPQGGGQPGDSGVLRLDGEVIPVVGAELGPAGILHRLPPGVAPPSPGTPALAELDWPRRYRFMRYHTALHLLSGVVFQRIGSGITGNQIAEDRARMDFAIPDFTRERAEELLAATNEVVARHLPVEVRFISPEERARRPELVRVATEGVAEGEEVRLIDIVGFDVQADGGTHVRSTAEVGPLKLEKIENKGARNKRLYLTLEPREPPAPHRFEPGPGPTAG